MMTHLAIYLLTSVLIGLNGPFTFTEKFERLEECIRAKVYYASQGMWAGGCKKGKGEPNTMNHERGSHEHNNITRDTRISRNTISKGRPYYSKSRTSVPKKSGRIVEGLETVSGNVGSVV